MRYYSVFVFFLTLSFAHMALAVQDVVWTDTVGVSVSGNSITKTAATGWGTGGAATTNSIAADGYVEFTTSSTGKAMAFGLSYANADAHFNTIDYAIMAAGGTSLNVYENGTFRWNGSYALNDVLRVERVGSVVVYKQNGTTVYTSTVSSAGAMIGDAALTLNGSTLSNAMIEMGSTGPLNGAVIVVE